jgi:hypothetical protein
MWRTPTLNYREAAACLSALLGPLRRFLARRVLFQIARFTTTDIHTVGVSGKFSQSLRSLVPRLGQVATV